MDLAVQFVSDRIMSLSPRKVAEPQLRIRFYHVFQAKKIECFSFFLSFFLWFVQTCSESIPGFFGPA